jgi:hypothetical protein
VNPEDLKIATASRLLRRRAGLRQVDLATPRWIAQEIEAGRAGRLPVNYLRSHFATLGAKAQFAIWWNGAALDRLFDQRHAEVVEATARTLTKYGFTLRAEYGERGSIDLFAGHERSRSVFVGEAKSEWGSLEETLRRQDAKVRLAPKLALAAFGWQPQFIASVFILPDDMTNRRVAQRYAAALGGYPARGREIRAWLRGPDGPLAGIWFLSNAGLNGRRVRPY